MSAGDDERGGAERPAQEVQDLPGFGRQATRLEGGGIGEDHRVDFAEPLQRPALHEGIEPLDGAGLEDVQRLALGLSDVGVEQEDAPE